MLSSGSRSLRLSSVRLQADGSLNDSTIHRRRYNGNLVRDNPHHNCAGAADAAGSPATAAPERTESGHTRRANADSA